MKKNTLFVMLFLTFAYSTINNIFEMTYEVDQSYEFKVVGGTEASDKEFLIEVDGPVGPAVVPMRKLPFQRDNAAPQVLYCRVKSIDVAGMPVLTPNIARYVYDLYNKIYVKGETFECTVTAVPDSPAEDPFFVVDRNGIFSEFMSPRV